MNKLKRYPACMLAVVLLLAAGCGKEKNEVSVPKGMVQVNFCQQGTFGAPFSDLTAEKGFVNLTRGSVPVGYDPKPIEDGTTLWVVVYEGAQGQEVHGEIVEVKSYRVSGQSLIPCEVDGEGNVTSEYDTPLYLPEGTYVFRALGPARELVRDTDGHYALNIDNGDWVIANDERYEETAGDATVTLTPETPDCLVHLKPLINQTARLKFTLYSAEDDPFVHSLKMHPVGVELSGLQRHYSNNGPDTAPWNWKFCIPGDTLKAFPGTKNVVIYLNKPLISTDDRFVIEASILPTDATATPLMALFNIEVNGNPTQFDMMLNRKIFRAGYSYHYRGRVYIDKGVTVMDWESVSWSADIPFFD